MPLEMSMPPPDCDRREALAFGQFHESSSIEAMEGSIVVLEEQRARTICPPSSIIEVRDDQTGHFNGAVDEVSQKAEHSHKRH